MLRILLFVLLLVGATWGEPGAALPVAEIPAQLEAARASLEALTAPDEAVEKVRTDLNGLTGEVDNALRLAPGANPTIEEAKLAAQQLRALSRRVKDARALLQLRAQSTSDELTELEGLEGRWRSTEAEARLAQVPAPLLADVASWRREASAVKGQLKARRALLLSLQSDLGDLDKRLEGGLKTAEATRGTLESRLLWRDSPPLWSPEAYAGSGVSRVPGALREQAVALLGYAEAHMANLALHLVLAAVLFWALRRVREFVQPWCDSRTRVRASLRVFDEPLLLAVLLSLAGVGHLYPDPPAALTAILWLLALLLAGRLLTRTLEAHLAAPVMVLGVLFMADILRGLVADVPVVARLLFLGEMLGGAVFLVFYLAGLRRVLGAYQTVGEAFGVADADEVGRGGGEAASASPRARDGWRLESAASGDSAWRGAELDRDVGGVTAEADAEVARGRFIAERRRLRWAMQAALGGFSLATLANLGGYLALGSLVGNATLRSAYLGLFMLAVLTILDGLVLVATLVPPLRLLRSVRRHRDLMHTRVRRFLAWMLGLSWLIIVLEQLSLWRPVRSGLAELLSARLTVGALSVSVGGVVGFVLILLAAGSLSRLVRFVLSEDVYPRVTLARGLPYALSTVAHYAVWVVGFLTAAAAAGLDPSRFTFLAGALGVGMGLGLQGIVNNFVSGLILLFERPVQVGDRVKLGDYVGRLESVGLRACVVRTDDGAQVIVPNGELMTTKVVNLSAANPAG